MAKVEGLNVDREYHSGGEGACHATQSGMMDIGSIVFYVSVHLPLTIISLCLHMMLVSSPKAHL